MLVKVASSFERGSVVSYNFGCSLNNDFLLLALFRLFGAMLKAIVEVYVVCKPIEGGGQTNCGE